MLSRSLLLFLVLTQTARIGAAETPSSQGAAPSSPANPALGEATSGNASPAGQGHEDGASAKPWDKLENPLPGVQFHLQYTTEILGNAGGGFRRGAESDSLAKVSLEVDPAKLLRLPNWTGATLSVNTIYPWGNSLSQRDVHDLNGVSNLEAYNSIRLNELWFQQVIGSFSARLGWLGADSEFFICDSGALFLNNCFGTFPTISLNIAAPCYPLTAPGIRLAYSKGDSFTLRAAVFDGDQGDPATDNRHGGRLAFASASGALYAAEAVWQTSGTLRGTYKIGGFYHSGVFPDVSGSGRRHRGDAGGYLICDQALFRHHSPDAGKNAASAPERGVNGFFRAGVTPAEDRNAAPWYLEAGLSCKGPFARFPSDSCGLACSCTRVSETLRKAEDSGYYWNHELVLEATYSAAITDWLAFQPDLQVIVHPALSRSSEAVILGARLSLSF